MSKEFVIPPLRPGDRIEDWKLLFQAAVTPFLAKDGGEKLAIGKLPGYINRRLGEKELVVEAIKMTTLAEAFELLCPLDDPVDPYLAMQKLCRKDWTSGMHVDDFFIRIEEIGQAFKSTR